MKDSPAFNELNWAAKVGLYLVFFIVLVFPHKVPATVVRSFTNPIVQVVAIGAIFGLMYMFDPLLGLLGSIVFLFLWSINFRKVPEEAFSDFKPVVVSDAVVATLLPSEIKDKRWFIEKVMNEQPYIIEEDLVRTNAVQDDSGRDSTNSHVSR
jgi:hypothetical protein